MSWRRFFRRKQANTELLQEIESYMAEEIAERVARGVTAQEAKRQARIKFGNSSAVRESLWQQNTISIFDKVGRDLRYSVRTPSFSFMAIGVMALCIGASTSLFTIVRSVLLRPLPFRDPNRLVSLLAIWRINTFRGATLILPKPFLPTKYESSLMSALAC